MNSTPTGTGFTGSPYSPDYVDMQSKEKVNEMNSRNPIQNSPWTPGVVLAKDSLDVPFVVEYGITDEKSNASKPSLMPLFRTRYVDTPTTEDKSTGYYNELKSRLSPGLQSQLTANEQKAFEEQDPDVTALNLSLHMEADWIAMAEKLAVKPPTSEEITKAAVQYSEMSTMVRNQTINYGTMISNQLDHYLSTQSSDSPGYDILLNASNQIKDALTILSH